MHRHLACGKTGWKQSVVYPVEVRFVGRLAEVTSHSNRRVSDPPYRGRNVGRLAEATFLHPLTGQRPALQLIYSKERKFLVVSKLKISQE